MLAHSPSIVMNGLVLCFDAGNTKSYPGSGTAWTDLSGNGNTGTLTNGPTYSSANGGSIVFDGTNDFVRKSSATTNLSAGVSVELILNGSEITSRTEGIFTYHGNPYFIEVSGYSPGKIYWANLVPVSVAGGGYYSSSILSNNTWYHFIGTYANGLSSMYINGRLDASASFTPANYPSTYTANIDIGVYTGYFYGNIGIVRVYNRALTASEVQQNFNALRGRFGI